MNNAFSQSLARALKTNVSTESVDVDINLGDDAIEADVDSFVDEDGAAVSPLAPATDEPIVEAQETEVQSDAVEIVEADTEIEDTEADVETLESIQLLLQKSLADEGVGLSAVSYEMLNISMDHIYRKYGITAAAVLPSMESFDTDHVAQTTISLEKVTETLKTIGEGAKEMLKKLWFTVKNFLMNLVKLNLSIQKRVDAVAAKAKEIGSDVVGEDIKLYSGNRLHIGGKVPAKDVVKTSYTKTVQANVQLATTAGTYLNDLVKEIANILNTQSVNGSENYDRVRQAVRAPLGYFNQNGNLSFQDAKFVKGLLDPKDGTPGGLKFETAKAPERDSDSSGYKIKPLTCTEIQAVCKEISESIKGIEAMGKLHSNKEIEKMITKLALKEAESEIQIDLKLILVAKIAVRQALNANSKVVNYVNTINKAMLDYCVQSLATHTKAAAKSEDKKDDTKKEGDK